MLMSFAEATRTFYLQKRAKNYQRSTETQDRLNGLRYSIRAVVGSASE